MLSRSALRAAIAAALSTVLFAGCASGGTSSSALPNAQTPVKPGASALSVHIDVPLTKTASTHTRRPQYVSPSTQSADVTVGASAPVTLNINGTAPGCIVNASLSEHQTPNLQPTQLAYSPYDGTMWYMLDSGSHSVQLGANAAQLNYVANGGRLTVAAAADKNDGSLWIGNVYGGSYLGHLTNSGSWSYSEIPLGTNANVSSIAQGADNAMYFNYQVPIGTNLAVIGRMAGGTYDADYGSGQITAGVSRIKAGTDGSLWFTEVNGMLGNMKGSSPFTVNNYPTGSSGSVNYGPIGLAVAPDNSVYLPNIDALGNTNSLAHISAAGAQLAPVPLGMFTGTITGLAVGPDGAIWIAPYAGYVGRVTAAGVFTQYPTPAGNAAAPTPAPTSGPTPPPSQGAVMDVAAGGDNQVYFTERDGNQIGNIALGYQCAAAVPAPVGSTSVTIKTYDAPNGAAGGGHLLGQTVNAPVTITPNATNTVTFTLDGIVDHVGLSLNPTSYPGFCAPFTGTTTVTAVPFDKDNNVIVGSGAVTDAAGNPLHIALSFNDADGTNTDSFAQPVLSWPGTPSSLANIHTNSYSISIGGTSTGSPAVAIPAISPVGISAAGGC